MFQAGFNDYRCTPCKGEDIAIAGEEKAFSERLSVPDVRRLIFLTR